MLEIRMRELRDGMADRAEIVDDGIDVRAEPLGDQRRTDRR
jgi:hypothetical protein